MVCVGIDVAKDKHDCCILDSEGTTLVDCFTIPNNMDKEGAALSYFRTEATARRKWSRPYWTRTPTGGGWTPSKAAYVTADGAFKSISAKSSYSYRPALVLPQEVLVDGEGNVLGG